MANWLECYLTGKGDHISPYVFDFNGDFSIPGGAKRANAWVQQKLRDVYLSDAFSCVREDQKPLGSHSIRKYGSLRARRAGANKDERDFRGRWKGHARTSDVYEEGEIPYPDAKVAVMLCPGGPCSYRIKANSPVTDDWILDNVVPNINRATVYGSQLKKLLGRALLWLCYSAKSHWVYFQTLERVKGCL